MKSLAPFSPANPAEWLLAFDFDGTLTIPEANPPVQPQFYELMQMMRDSHKAFWGINTGRSLMQTVQGLADARFPFLPDYIIAREREIYTPNEFGRWVGLPDWNSRCEKEHHKLFRRCRRVLKKLQQWIETETAAVWGMQEGEPAGIVASTASEMDFIVQKIDQEISSKPLLSYQRNGIYLRFSHSHYHKGSAMVEVARQLGLSADKTFAIGDSHNDLDMLDPAMASLLACPGNACDEVKTRVSSLGGYVSEGVASVGTIEALCASFITGGGL
ncbi:MAG: HAD family phosphatase [Akkermansiaceae bacterium]|nr:HAD family phosphatase [Akkermansiaceae bacterium]